MSEARTWRGRGVKPYYLAPDVRLCKTKRKTEGGRGASVGSVGRFGKVGKTSERNGGDGSHVGKGNINSALAVPYFLLPQQNVRVRCIMAKIFPSTSYP